MHQMRKFLLSVMMNFYSWKRSNRLELKRVAKNLGGSVRLESMMQSDYTSLYQYLVNLVLFIFIEITNYIFNTVAT